MFYSKHDISEIKNLSLYSQYKKIQKKQSQLSKTVKTYTFIYRVHNILKCVSSKFLETWVRKNTILRNAAKEAGDTFLSSFFKFVINALFGKS